MINTPYVKQYENGILINPIVKIYPQEFSNRRSRRENRKSHQKSVSKNQGVVVALVGRSENGRPTYAKYQKSIQKIGNKIIQHLHWKS